jgi:hypothetical protein
MGLAACSCRTKKQNCSGVLGQGGAAAFAFSAARLATLRGPPLSSFVTLPRARDERAGGVLRVYPPRSSVMIHTYPAGEGEDGGTRVHK